MLCSGVVSDTLSASSREHVPSSTASSSAKILPELEGKMKTTVQRAQCGAVLSRWYLEIREATGRRVRDVVGDGRRKGEVCPSN